MKGWGGGGRGGFYRKIDNGRERWMMILSGEVEILSVEHADGQWHGICYLPCKMVFAYIERYLQQATYRQFYKSGIIY